MYVEQTSYMRAEEIMRDAAKRTVGQVFFEVKSTVDLNKIAQEFPFYDYTVQVYTRANGDTDVVRYLTKAVYKNPLIADL